MDLFGDEPAKPKRSPTKRELKRELKAKRAALHEWAGDVLHRDVGHTVCDKLGRLTEQPPDLVLLDGSGPATGWRRLVLAEVGAADPITNAELLRLAIRAGLASPETAAELKARLAECRALHRRVYQDDQALAPLSH